MARADEVDGVRASKESPVVVPQPTRPERQFMKKEDVMKAKAAEREANEAAEAARVAVLKKHGVAVPERTVEKQAGSEKGADKVAKLRNALVQAEKELAEKPTNAKLKQKVQKLSEELDEAEGEGEEE